MCQRNCNTKMYVESVVWGSESLLTQVNGDEAKFVEVLRHKKGGSGFNKSLENFQGLHRVQFPVGSLEIFEWFIPSVRIQWPWSPLTLWETGILRNYLGSKVRHLHRADNFAVLVVPNVKVRMGAQHSIPPLSLHDFLQQSFTYLTQDVFKQRFLTRRRICWLAQ